MNDGFNEFDERLDEAYQLSEYYSELVGRNIVFGLSSDDEYWLNASRTYDYEYFATLNEAEQRVKQLYADILPDDGDYTDPYEGL